jgi:DNA repair photolyase
MDYKVINCDSILKKITKKDTLFHGDYCLDPYQNCEFNCQYCDSSLEKTLYIKKNSIEVLQNQLSSLPKGRIIVGSVHDPYQPAEKKYLLTQSILTLLQDYDFPCHILTKSPLVLRDIDLISVLNCYVTISISSLDDHVVNIFEPQVSSPSDRLHTIQKLRMHHITTGVALIPIFPYIVEPELETIVKNAQRNSAQYLLYKHLELKGEQKQHFMNIIRTYYPQLVDQYTTLYQHSISPDKIYVQNINNTLARYCRQFNIPDAIPRNK